MQAMRYTGRMSVVFDGGHPAETKTLATLYMNPRSSENTLSYIDRTAITLDQRCESGTINPLTFNAERL